MATFERTVDSITKSFITFEAIWYLVVGKENLEKSPVVHLYAWKYEGDFVAMTAAHDCNLVNIPFVSAYKRTSDLAWRFPLDSGPLFTVKRVHTVFLRHSKVCSRWPHPFQMVSHRTNLLKRRSMAQVMLCTRPAHAYMRLLQLWLAWRKSWTAMLQTCPYVS